ncbi:MAG: RtcB family protein [Nitrospinae bacterium]|nr:RtcB family protein [Nitrospinota bacterium]
MSRNYNIFAEKADDQTLRQFHSAMDQPFVVKGALLPDAHVGYSLPIGAVVATEGVILPAWVGYDIGCGMCAVKTPMTVDEIMPLREKIFQSIYRAVPTGFAHNKRPEQWNHEHIPMTPALKKIFGRDGLCQLGSLGGGNHFIELSYDEEKHLWVVVHSGSRNVGHSVATHYMKLASGSEKAKEGHYGFDTKSGEGRDYITDMKFCQEFALENRKKIIERVLREIYYYAKPGDAPEQLEFINRNHNHAEEKDGLWIHRKGATQAEEGMAGVIPGNMRDGSFVVEGKGNPKSLNSSSHGAGRALSRNQAKAKLTMDDFRRQLEGITAKVAQSTLDEAPAAYKDIFEIMRLQADMVTVKHHLIPVVNIKG